MNTLEEIMRDVTPPETWEKQGLLLVGGELNLQHIIPSIALFREKPDMEFAIRSARNFAPLVKALEDICDKIEQWEEGVEHVIGRRPESGMSTKEARVVLAEALRKEP